MKILGEFKIQTSKFEIQNECTNYILNFCILNFE